MRILLVNYMDTLMPGGINTVVRELAKHLAKKGHYVVVFNPSWSGRKQCYREFGNLTIIRGHNFNRALYGLNIRNFMYILKLMKRFRPDIIHLHGFHNLFIPLTIILIKLFYPSKLVVFSPHYAPGGHASSLSSKVFKLYSITVGKILYKLIDAMVCSSLFELKSFVNIVGLNSTEKLSLIPHGVSYEPSLCRQYITPSVKKIVEDNASESYQRVLKLLYVGYLLEYKGVQDVIKALARLNREFGIGATLTVIGEGPYKPALIKLAKQLGVIDSVIWKPFVKREELIKNYCQTDVFVFLSRGEMFGLVAYEALALSKPVIVAKKAALIECCYKYANCICVESAEELAEKIIELLNRLHTSTNLKSPPSWSEIVTKYLELYSQIRNVRGDV
uniref:Glycosyltransferase family 1 protein n=1 Tax=Ignisphaera aggregans TaxID=334771 RepID=A0A7J3Z9H8_9CREN